MELKPIETIFPKNLFRVLIINRVKKIIISQNSVNVNKLDYKARSKKIPDLPVFYALKCTRVLNRISKKEISKKKIQMKVFLMKLETMKKT